MTSTTKKIPKQVVVNAQNKREVLTPFERDLDFVSLLKFDVEGVEVGGYLCQKNGKESTYKMTFAFECEGINPTMTSALLEDVFTRVEGGLKDIPDGETITFHIQSFADDIDRQLELNEIAAGVKANTDPNRADSTVLRGLLYSEKERTAALMASGSRKPKVLRIYCSYTYEATEGETDGIEKSINYVLKFFRQNVTGQQKQRKYQELNTFLGLSFQEGYKQWERILGGKMGLELRPLSVEQIWKDLWKRFNRTPCAPLPAHIYFDGKKATDVSGSQLSVISLLLAEEISVPKPSRNYIHCNGKYQALLHMTSKPEGWRDEMEQIRYIFSILIDEEITDTEIISQLTKGNAKLLQEKLSTLTAQSIGRANDAANNAGTVNVKATVDIQRSIEAQELLYNGNVPLRMSTAFIIHRDRPQDLEDACRNLSGKVLRPAIIEREVNFPWHPWIQTFPGLVWEKLYAAPYDLRFNCLTSEAPGFFPIVKPTSPDRTGFELIAAEGMQPIFLDLFSAVKHMGIFATTRAGKSVLVSGILTHALARGMPVSIIDYPRADGTGTFSEFVPLLKGAYFNTATESLNLFELPDLRQFDKKTQEERQADFQDSLLEILLTIVMGSKSNGDGQQEVRSILTSAMDCFFKEAAIQRRYHAASTGGFGSEAWDKVPTLIDYLGFCEIGRLKITTPTPELLRAIEYIKLRFNAFIVTKMGKSLSQPSSFQSKAQIFAVALANLGNQEDALIIAMATNLVILRRSLGFSRSIIFIDEAPILFSFEAIAEQVAKFFANGAKSGIGVIISAQESGSIAQSKHAEKVFANLQITLIGRIQEKAVDSFVKNLKIPQELALKCAAKSFFPNLNGFYSQWMVYDGQNYTLSRYYPGFLQLAAVANNPPETAIRLKYMAMYKHPIEALIATAKELMAIAAGK